MSRASFRPSARGPVIEELKLGLEDGQGMDWSSLALAGRERAAAPGGGGSPRRGEEGRSCCPSQGGGQEGMGLFVKPGFFIQNIGSRLLVAIRTRVIYVNTGAVFINNTVFWIVI
jgi:hypothetical protein